MFKDSALHQAVKLFDLPVKKLLLSTLLGVLALGSAIALAATSAWLIARASQMPPVMTLTVATVSVRAFGVSRGVFRYLERLASHSLALQAMGQMRANVYRNLAKSNPAQVMYLRRGELLARLGGDVDTIGEVIVKSFLPIAVGLVLALGSVTFFFFIDPLAATILLLGLLLGVAGSSLLVTKAAGQNEAESLAVRGQISSQTLELLNHSAEHLVRGSLSAELSKLGGIEKEWQRVTRRAAAINSWATGLLALASGSVIFAIIVLCQGHIATGTLGAVQLAVLALTPITVFEVLSTLPQAGVNLRTANQSAQRVLALLAEPTEPTEPTAVATDAASSSLTNDNAPTSRIDAGLQAKNLSFGWQEHLPLGKNIDLNLSAGQSVAVAGASGCGKTTLLITLAGLLPPQKGHVISAPSLYVAEDSHIFNTSILENLRLADGNLKPEQAKNALREVGLGPWLESLPDGLETVLASDGLTISGGERRRLILARSLLSEASVILLDEPLEHLDSSGVKDTLLYLVTQSQKTKKTLLFATHQLAGLALVDQVLYFDTKGNLISDTHENLLATSSDYRLRLELENQGEHSAT